MNNIRVTWRIHERDEPDNRLGNPTAVFPQLYPMMDHPAFDGSIHPGARWLFFCASLLFRRTEQLVLRCGETRTVFHAVCMTPAGMYALVNPDANSCIAGRWKQRGNLEY